VALWPDVIVTAGVSVSLALVTAKILVTRQERAKEHTKARLELSRAVDPLLAATRMYHGGQAGERVQRELTVINCQDYLDASRLLKIINRLSPVRRALGMRRLRRIYGVEYMDVVASAPCEDPHDVVGYIAPVVRWAMAKAERPEATPPLGGYGILLFALCQPPGFSLQRRLIRELRFLQAAL
jgi:hypothetical protein